MTTGPDRERNPDRTREAILDAAERLFARQGYDATSLSQVGKAAGVSRGTPGYFFGSKAELYRAVLERCFGEVHGAVRSGRDRALASGEGPEVVLAGAVSEYFDFLVARPNFVRLLERQALGGNGALPNAPAHIQAGREALAALAQELGLDPGPSGEAAQLLLSIVALCWFPVVHAGIIAPALGVDLGGPEAVERRKRHVIELVLHGVHGRAVAAGDQRMADSEHLRTP
ncbi:MAG TPA: TetR/AcrR family transcriptional regulator [Gemmatimonadales bacterium]|nr:TetR/AcrR family transcriptional regulator [Gemmatimonadales bacterium]